MKQAVLTLIRLLGLAPVLRRWNRRKPVVLTYHGFTDQPATSGLGGHLHMPVDEFEAQLRFLSEHYAVVPLEDVIRHCEGKLRLPDNALAITIDDGYRSVYELAFPLLVRYRLPATVFLATDFVETREYLWHDRMWYCIESCEQDRLELDVGGNTLLLDLSSPEAKRASSGLLSTEIKTLSRAARDALLRDLEKGVGRFLGESEPVPETCKPMSWVQVKEMAASGLIAFGSHTRTHVIVSRCTDDEMVEELAASKAMIEERTGVDCPLFCYPNGTPNDFSARTRAALVEAGYRCGLTTVPGLVGGGSDAYELPRFSSNAGVPTLELKLAGFAELRKLLG